MTTNNAIEIKNLGKSYIINHQANGGSGYVALRDVIASKAKSLFTPSSWFKGSIEQEEFWALKNIDLNINKGDKVAIIGHNGAGKSTLLKLLSQITEPTTGEIRINGRVTSLLEVGTGFHPELTGRENIYLNGSILGMSKAEVKQKFNDIVAFAGVEKFLDTPVKRYSSGMRMRLGFAVAAHLESEILIIDEVLAVGDAAFQKKCLGKMDDISKSEGRTILFVSHNMGAVKSLCNKGVVLNQGEVAFTGDVSSSIEEYLKFNTNTFSNNIEAKQHKHPKGNITASHIKLLNQQGEETTSLTIGTPYTFKVSMNIKEAMQNVRFGFIIKNNYGDVMMNLVEDQDLVGDNVGKNEDFDLACTYTNHMSPGNYTLDIIMKRGNDLVNYVSNIPFYVSEVLETNKNDIQKALMQTPSAFKIYTKE